MGRISFFVVWLVVFLCSYSSGQTSLPVPSENVILITVDGLRWQEVFGGAVDSLVADKTFTKDSLVIASNYVRPTRNEARKQLMPFFWSELVAKGQLFGNRWADNKVNCTNRFWFSYPGYNEILTGVSDPYIDSNAKQYNNNKTILEWLNVMPKYKGKVAAFCSWDVFPFIINDKRSGIPVNSGFDTAHIKPLSAVEQVLNRLQGEIPPEWNSVRYDAFTHHYAKEYMKKYHPKVVYISYGETDDFAHDGRYDRYLEAANRTDQFIADIWQYVNSDPFYKGKTTLIITTDHGRGYEQADHWKSHGTIYKGSDEIWIGLLGSSIAAKGEITTNSQLYQNQIASTLAKVLGLEYSIEDGGEYINLIWKK